jgi:hypothetical protein
MRRSSPLRKTSRLVACGHTMPLDDFIPFRLEKILHFDHCSSIPNSQMHSHLLSLLLSALLLWISQKNDMTGGSIMIIDYILLGVHGTPKQVSCV